MSSDIVENPKVDDSVSQEINDSALAVGDPRARINNLTPPPTTSFFKFQTRRWMTNHVMGASRKFGTITWSTDIYTYAANANPKEPNFAQKGGQLFFVMVHSGHVRIYDNFSADVWDRMEFQLTPRESGLVASLQLPASETGVQVGNNFNYTIDYGHIMQLFRNNGNETFPFDAKYHETFTRVRSKQIGSRAGSIVFGVNTTGSSNDHRTTEIYGLSVFTHNDPTKFPVQPGWRFEINGRESWAIGGTWNLNLGF